MGKQQKPAKKPPRKPGTPLADPVRERYAGQRAMGMSQEQAYRKAKPGAEKRERKSVSVSATRMDAEPEVQARIAEINVDLLRSSDAYLTKAKLAELLSDAIRRALTDDTVFSTGPGLVDKYCKMFGFYEPEKHEMQVGCLDAGERDRKIERLLKLTVANVRTAR